MQNNDSITFKESLTRSEIDSLLNDLIAKRIKIQDPNGGVFIIVDIIKEKLITDLDYRPKFTDKTLKLELRYEDVKFEFETEVKKSKDRIYLTKPSNITKFQRRENYRTSIPKGVSLNIQTFINDKPIKVSRIINISLTGVLIAVKGFENLDFQDHFYADIKYEDQNFRIEGDIVRVDLQSNEILFAVEYNTKMATHKAALHQFLLHCFRISKSLT